MSSPNKSVLLGEDKLAANPSLPSVSSPILAPGNRAPKNTPAGRSFDNTDEGDSTENNNNASKVNSNAVAAALDQLKLDTASKDPALKIPGLTAFGELTVEVEELLELHTSKGIETRDQYVLERVALEMKYDAIRLQAQQERAHIVNGTGVGDSSSTAGVPEFWSTCIQNHPQLSTLLGEQDEAALAHLTDIRVTHPAKDYNQGFALEFYFSENAYFTNRVLTKTYHMESLVLKLAEEPELLHSESTVIEWKEGMDFTTKKETKRVRRKGKSGKKNSKTVVKMIQNETIFTIFDTIPSMEDATDEKHFNKIEELVMMDFEVALLFMNQIVPNAIMWYTGEFGDSDFDPEEAMFGDSEDDEEELESDDDADFQNPFGVQDGSSASLPTDTPKDAQEDCKTQ